MVKRDIKLLNKCKIEVNNLIKNITNEIHKKYVKNTNNKIKNELLKTNVTIDFWQIKT